MKQYFMSMLLLIQLSLLSAGNAAAGFPDADRYKQVSGRYGSNDGICLFDDGRFLLYGYATAVFGHYVFDKERMLFYPEKPELFEVYATRNMDIGDSTRINFREFERSGKVFVQFDRGPLQPAFNEDANCFDPPFVYVLPRGLTAFTAYRVQGHEPGGTATPNVWQFHSAGYNDFIWICNRPKREQQDFAGVLRKEGREQRILLSNYGGETGYRKRVMEGEELGQWQEMLDMKAQYYRDKEKVGSGLLANEHYKLFLEDEADYRFDTVSNRYIRKSTTADGADYRSNPYADDRSLRRYVKLQPATQSNQRMPAGAAGSLFYSVCGEDSGRSYHYSAAEPVRTTADPPMVMTAPIPETATGKAPEANREEEYTRGDLVVKSVYRDHQLVWEERWNQDKRTATIKHFIDGATVFRAEITNRYSLLEEVITVYDGKGKLWQRKVASEKDGAIWFMVYDARGRFIRKEPSYEVQDWLKDPQVRAGNAR